MLSDWSSEQGQFTKELANSVPFQQIASAAVESGFIIRSRKIYPIEFILTLIFGFYSKEEPSISKFHRLYNSIVSKDKQVVYSSFYDRFNGAGLVFVEKCLENYILNQMKSVNSELKGYMRIFKDVLIKDNTIVRVHSYLEKKYPATRTRRIAAGIKLSFLLSIISNGPKSVQIFSEKTNDAKTLTIGPWVKDMLLLMDRGFFKFDFFSKIESFGGSYVTRLKSNTKAELVSVNLGIPEKIRAKIVGLDIQDALKIVKAFKLDLDAEVKVNYIQCGKTREKSTLNMRFIAIYNEIDDNYFTYFTNIPENDLGARDVASLYAARWDIENLFRELKSENLLGRLKSKNENITEILILISIIRLIISRNMFAVARRILEPSMATRLRKRLWAIVFAENARRILRNIIRKKMRLRVTAPWCEIWQTLVEGSISAHVKRTPRTAKLYI